jgi:hypothetical protein
VEYPPSWRCAPRRFHRRDVANSARYLEIIDGLPKTATGNVLCRDLSPTDKDVP